MTTVFQLMFPRLKLQINIFTWHGKILIHQVNKSNEAMTKTLNPNTQQKLIKISINNNSFIKWNSQELNINDLYYFTTLKRSTLYLIQINQKKSYFMVLWSWKYKWRLQISTSQFTFWSYDEVDFFYILHLYYFLFVTCDRRNVSNSSFLSLPFIIFNIFMKINDNYSFNHYQ